MSKVNENDMEAYFDRLWPICRSITGKGLRESLQIISEVIPLQLTEIPTGTRIFDWEIPKEWNVTDAYIVTPEGKKICEFRKNNLHLVNYSIPVDGNFSFEELEKHLFSIPEMPDAIPYLTSYYKETWGFCISHSERLELPKTGLYKVKVESSLVNGSLSYGECVLKGDTDEEILFSTYVCHPSMANNELSGPLVTAFLYKKLAALPRRRFTYRFVFAPETIGVIAFLGKEGMRLKEKLAAGYVVTCVGDNGKYTYKRSRDFSHQVNTVAEHYLKFSNKPHTVLDFSIGGSDERQYCSPGFNLPVGSLMRTMYQRYKEYHTSLDNKSFISFPAMNETVETYFNIARLHELNRRYMGSIQYCEPQLGKRGLYPEVGGQKNRAEELSMRLHLLSWADGKNDLISIAERLGKPALEFEETIKVLQENKLLSDSN
jgi:aminopeptidase-like protein